LANSNSSSVYFDQQSDFIIFFFIEAAIIPDKNETDYIAQYHSGVKLPMGKK